MRAQHPCDGLWMVGCPVLVMAGDQDQHTTLAETRRIYETAKEPKELALFEGAALTDLLSFDPKRYRETVLGFLDRHLRKANQHWQDASGT